MFSPDKTSNRTEGEQKPAAPSISLPKGGGAIRGVGEKFAANPVTGTGSMTVPIATSPGRAGFGPALSMSYDSGSGNGPFGFGWSLSLPSITRKTDKGLPQYHDAEESDVFILSGAEDLVPVLQPDGTRHVDDTIAAGYTVHRYRPRIEKLFARIERWRRLSDGDVHWRAISRDNVLTLYGADGMSRIADPADPKRIFSWLISETRDDKGNAVLYGYKDEDGAGVDLSRASERNRGGRDDPRRAVNRYLKRIRYGNRKSLLDDAGLRPRFLADLTPAAPQDGGWMFEVVFDYGEHDVAAPRPDDAGPWRYRDDPFSSYQSGFEVRTTRLCRRVLMFHHIPDLPSGAKGYDGLVRSTDFTYSHQEVPARASNPIYTFLSEVTQTGYRRNNAGYDRQSLPPVAFEYSQPAVQDKVQEVDPKSLEGLPAGVDGTTYQWTDLHGEGIPGILTEQAGAWFYQRNMSPIGKGAVEFAPPECVATKPNQAYGGGEARFLDLAGDGRPDLVILDGPTPGLYEHDGEESWEPFRPFTSRLNRDTRASNLRFIDLNGDGQADIVITEDDAIVWHPSLGEAGFGPARRVAPALDEEQGPRLVFADGAESIHLADFSSDGLTDLVRIRNGEVSYWPNLGYGRFGAKVSMDHAPRFDHPDQFDQKRLRLADIDGSGTTDIIYLHRDGVRLYFNQSGNGWSEPRKLDVFPRVDDLVSIVAADLLGNGTACLVWSSSLPGDARRPMRYVNLMGGQKPHLLVKVVNNLGAETVVHYAPSTKFFLQDKRDGTPWVTRLPFPVHVVERVETHDHISRNRFVATYRYHDGYFDGDEREFRGFATVEQQDAEELAALTTTGTLPPPSNLDPASHVPPVLTKTWFHTGARALVPPNTVLPPDLSPEEEREAYRSLKGLMLRQEVYSLDGTPKEGHPYVVSEQSFGIRLEQPRRGNRHAVFFSHPRDALTCHYERNPADPRVQHTLTLEVDGFGNVLKEATIGYGRRQPDHSLPLQVDRDKQTITLVTYTENRVTKAIDDDAAFPGACRAPLPCETLTYELTGYTPSSAGGRFQASDFVQAAGAAVEHRFDTAIEYEGSPTNGKQRRPIEQTRILYRADDLTALLPLGQVQSLALPGESYRLAFTPGLVAQVFQRNGQPLLPNPAGVLGGQGADGGGYLSSQQLKADGRFPRTDPDGSWWVPAGRVFLSPDANDTAALERTYAQRHYFLPIRFRDPFHSSTVSTESVLTYDAHDLLMAETRDPLDNRVTVGERRPDGTIDTDRPGNDYRVLQPALVTDPNRNRIHIAFDALGMVVGTAVMGKPLPAAAEGDSLDGFAADLTPAQLDGFHDAVDPRVPALPLLNGATTRIIYDPERFLRSQRADPDDPTKWLAVYAATVVRETHESDPAPAGGRKVQVSFSYSDGFGREIQRKIQAEPGPLVEGGPIVTPRWVGSGWTVFNNKGKPVRQFEPFFSATRRFEFGMQVGVSSILFYDPVERVVATLHPNNTHEKVVFDPWIQVTWDVNDTVLSDPRADADIRGYTSGYFAGLRAVPAGPPWETWHTQRNGGARGPLEQVAALKAAAHAATPTIAHLDTLGRPFLTLADNGPDPAHHGEHMLLATRVDLDIEGNQRAVRDAVEQGGDLHGRIVVRYAYDMLGTRTHQLSMEAGARWMLNDVLGKTIRAWDSRDHTFRTEYDPKRRPLRSFVTGADTAKPAEELLTERLVYGEQHPGAEALNLRGKLFLLFDQAGSAGTEAHDFKANPLSTSRRLTNGTQYRQTVDWRAVDADHAALPLDAKAVLDFVALHAALAPQLEADTYTTRTTYDALNRPITLTTPHASGMQPSVVRPKYNEASLLERVEVNLRGAVAGGQQLWTSFVGNIDYDAKGQRQRIDYGNGVSTFYDYDPLTYRLVGLRTRRDAVSFSGDCPQPTPAGWPGCQVQDLHYTYDPVGNITHLRDDAQQIIFFSNQRVEPSAEYRYDATYRLIDATGREHLGQIGGAPIPHSHDDARRSRQPHPTDGRAMGTYTESYVYDAVGNFLEMRHRGGDPTNPGWTRKYVYAETSLIEDGAGAVPLKTGNRLSSTEVGGNNPPIERYVYDAHGNMVRMPHLGGAHPVPNMRWNCRDQLAQTDLGGGGTAYYVYDAAGQRARKVWEKPGGLTEERIYLGGLEIFRQQLGAARLQRETLHVMDDKRSIALVETRTVDTAGTDPAPVQLIRFQFGNHLGSASLELDHQAQIISYEEYTPYGSTSYQAVRSQTETPKRYRYTGKERDDETGLYFQKARYYATWLGRWSSSDPAGMADGTNVFAYVRGNPLMYRDPTGESCDPAISSCVEPEPLAREEALQTSLPEDERYLPATSEATPPPQPAARPKGRVVAPPPPVSPTNYALYVPQGVIYAQREAAIREVDDPDNPWYVRAGMFVLGTAATPLALAEEYVGRPLTNIPFFVHNAGTGIGEHTARAAAWSEQGETGEAVVEGLEATVSFSKGFVVAASVAAPIAGALKSRATTLVTSSAEAAPVSSGGARGTVAVAEQSAARAIPELTAGTNREMLGQAVRHVQALEGSALQRANLFEQMAAQINRLSGGSWSAVRGTGTGGSHVFLGEAGEALVINAEGQVFRGSLTSGAIQVTGPGQYGVNFSLLRPL